MHSLELKAAISFSDPAAETGNGSLGSLPLPAA
jgi:hypothetical protein